MPVYLSLLCWRPAIIRKPERLNRDQNEDARGKDTWVLVRAGAEDHFHSVIEGDTEDEGIIRDRLEKSKETRL